MKGARTFTLLLATAIIGSVYAEDLGVKIKKSDQAVCNALKRKDLATFEKVVKAGITADFKYVEEGREMTFDQMFSTMKMSVASMDKITDVKALLKKLAINEEKGTAVATEIHLMKWTGKGPDGKVHRFSMSGMSTDEYVKQGGKWLMNKMTWSNTKMMMDGKVMPMGPAPK